MPNILKFQAKYSKPLPLQMQVQVDSIPLPLQMQVQVDSIPLPLKLQFNAKSSDTRPELQLAWHLLTEGSG
jgi:hypothetical protein